MGSLCSNTQLHNQLLAPMRSWNYLPDSTPLLPFTTLGFTTFIPFLLYLSVQILNAYYYALQLNIIHKFLSHLYAFNSLFLHSFTATFPPLYNCTLLTMWFTFDYHIQLTFFLPAFTLLHLPLLHSAFMTFL